MNKIHTDKIFNDFKSYWKNANDMSKSLMCFGFDCDDGWFKLIYKLCKDIEKALDKDRIYQEDFVVLQVKEKFGGLRFYCSGTTEDIEKLIDDAEEKSFKICEICSKPGKCKQVNHWYRTVCDKHYKEWITRKNKLVGKKEVKNNEKKKKSKKNI